MRLTVSEHEHMIAKYFTELVQISMRLCQQEQSEFEPIVIDRMEMLTALVHAQYACEQTNTVIKYSEKGFVPEITHALSLHKSSPLPPGTIATE